MCVEDKGSISYITYRGGANGSETREGGLEIRKGKGGSEGSQDGVSREVITRGDWEGGGAANKTHPPEIDLQIYLL